MHTKNESIFIFAFVIVIIIIVVFFVYQVMERRKRKDIQARFRDFSQNFKVSKKNVRTVPRVLVPPQLEVVLTFTDDAYFGLKAYATDISLSGFSVRPDFPLKKLPLDLITKNVLVATPVNTFVIKEMKTIRIDHHVDRRLLAFHILKIDEDQFVILKQFMNYLDEFLKKRDDENPR